MKKIMIPILILMVVLCSCAAKGTNEPPVDPSTTTSTTVTEPEPEIKEETKKSYKAAIYFASEDAMYLIPEEREIKYEAEDELPLKVVKCLLSGPSAQNLYPVLNKDTVINSVSVNSGVATVSVDENFISLNSGGSTKEFMALYSIVNSLCELDSIDSVKFCLSDGTPVSEFGSYIIDLPLVKDTTMAD